MRQRSCGNNKTRKRCQEKQQEIVENCCLSKRCKYDNIWQHFKRNATLEEIRSAAARICRDYLTGRWKVVAPESLVVKRISGGLSNFLYYVSLPDLDEEDEAAEEQRLLEQQQQHANGNVVAKDNVIVACGATNVVPKNSAVFARNVVEVEHVSESVSVTADDDNTATSAKQAHKRQRFDSDSGDSSSLKRLHAPKQEPREVLLRIYGQTHGDHALESMITESVVFALLSERNFGPKLHGIFPGGRIEQYLPARALATAELSEQRILLKVAEKMGEIHSLNIPMSKEPDWIWNCMQRWVTSFESIVKGKMQSKPDSAVLQKQRELMRTIDYVQEIAWLRSVIDSGDYPVVFCHNDLQEGNILLRQVTPPERTQRESISSLRSNFDETLGESLDGNSNLSEPEAKRRQFLLLYNFYLLAKSKHNTANRTVRPRPYPVPNCWTLLMILHWIPALRMTMSRIS